MFGSFSGSPSSACAMRGMKASSARVSRMPEPSAFTIASCPRRIASTSPGTPSFDCSFSSSGSENDASILRHSTLTGSSPAIVRTITCPSCTVRSSPSSSMKPR